MSIKSIKIKNLLSFEELIINDLKDINCIVGKNNTGKSNLLKLIRFFYNKLDGKRELTPKLNSNYSAFGTITIIYDISHIFEIVQARKNKHNPRLPYFKEIYKIFKQYNEKNTIEITLVINSDESTKWNRKDKYLLRIINDIYPFFNIETRHIDLYHWEQLWILISRLKPFNPHKVDKERIIEFFEKEVSGDLKYKNYGNYINTIEKNLETGGYSYRDKVLNFVKVGLKGHSFLIDNKNLETESDGMNSYTFIKSFLILLISLTRKSYVVPIIYIDEPEIGLHPKKNEELIYELHNIYDKYSHYEAPYPKIIFATHSPNIVKNIIIYFKDKQQILHFSKDNNNTIVKKVNSTYDDNRFLNIFSDNEARLFFSDFILFVEGSTEEEIFRNLKLQKKFKILHKIDIYSGSSVSIENINPSYSAASIPYLILFDADKIFHFKRTHGDTTHREVVLRSNGKLFKLKNEIDIKVRQINYKYNNHEKKLQKYVKDISSFIKKKYTFSNVTFKLEKQREYLFFIESLNKYLKESKNIYFVKTTIEEVLINNKSKDLFFMWILEEYSFDKEEICKKNKYITSQILIDYVRIFFGGKFETQISFSNLEKEVETKDCKKIFNLIKNNNNFPVKKYIKTSGWVTKFLNFSIDEIEKNINKMNIPEEKEQEKQFKLEFKKYFEELYDIIRTIEKKL